MKNLNLKKLIFGGITSAFVLSVVIFCSCSQVKKVEIDKFPNTAAENAIITEQYKQISQEMTDFTINEFKDNIAKIPRESGHVEQILDYVYNWGISHNLKTTKDQSGCIYYDVPATSGCENFPLIILQAHTDMVHTCADPSIDMSKTPVDIVFDEETNCLHSRDNKTNIGADDAEGMTALMALATNKNYSHGPLRMLFTYDEETTMQGAIKVSPEVIDAKYLINIDGGPVGGTEYSSAGIFKVEITDTYQLEASNFEKKLDVNIKDLYGGHSGVDIAKNRMSANVVVIESLKKLIDEGVDFQIINISGGNATNAIPSYANFSLLVKCDDAQKANDLITETFNSQKEGKTEDKNASIEITESNRGDEKALSLAESKNLVELLGDMPHGCRETDKDDSTQPTVSSNLGIIRVENGQLKIVIHSRSNINGKNEELDQQLRETCNKHQATYTVTNSYKPWEKNEDTRINDLYTQSFKNVCDVEPVEYRTHAGLECSRFLEKNPNLNMLCLGMDVANEHMVTECLYTKSIPVFYASLINMLENANQL